MFVEGDDLLEANQERLQGPKVPGSSNRAALDGLHKGHRARKGVAVSPGGLPTPFLTP